MIIYSIDVLLSLFGISLFFHVWFYLLLLDLHTDFSVRWSSIPIFLENFPQFVVIHTVKWFCIVNKAEVDAFLELSCFFYDPADIGNLISGSSAFSKSSLNNWTFWSLAWRILSNLIMEEEMATHPGILSWENSQTEEPGGLQSMKSQRVRHDLAT